MLWCLHNDKHGELYSLDEKVYIVDTDDLKVEKSTFGELLPYLKNGLVIENVSTEITDNLADFVEVKNGLSMSNRLLAGDLSMSRGSNLVDVYSSGENEEVFELDDFEPIDAIFQTKSKIKGEPY